MEVPGHEDFGFLKTKRGVNIPQLEPIVEIISRFWVFLPRSIFPISCFHLFIPLLHLPSFPSLLYPFLSPFLITILSHFSVTDEFAGWQVGRPSSLSTFPCHKFATTLHLTIFATSPIHRFKPSYSKFRDFHFSLEVL
jgi:hypothetical protein